MLVACAACSRPVQLVTAPVGTASSVQDAGIVARRSVPAESQLGTFVGTGVQSDGHSWPLRVELTETTGRCATVAYSSVPCQGFWTCKSVPAADGFREATETITSGHCIDGGTFRYRIQDDSLEFSWNKSDEHLTARGTLTRSNASTDSGDDTPEGELDE